ncbi:hypothetical protein CR513_52402, partial [Mucuna pruriens]
MTILLVEAKGKILVHNFRHDVYVTLDVIVENTFVPLVMEKTMTMKDHGRRKKCKPPPYPKKISNPNNTHCTRIHQNKTKPLWIYKIDIEILREEGLLPLEDLSHVTWSPYDHHLSCKIPI